MTNTYYFPMIYYRSFIILALTFRSMIHLQFMFQLSYFENKNSIYRLQFSNLGFEVIAAILR